MPHCQHADVVLYIFFTFFQYIADNRIENNPWHGVDEWALKVKLSGDQ